MQIIEAEHLVKDFRLGQLTDLRRSFINLGRRVAGRAPLPGEPRFKALDDVSFSVDEGEVLGLIGHNGAGKSTLLKVLSNIVRPSSGRVAVRGRVSPLIEVSAGLVPDLTGRENIYLNGAILGMRRAEIARKLDEIIAFAELESFIDTPVKRYSSGMLVRLGFSIATAVESEILIIDEVLAVGDIAFQRKCYDRIESYIHRQGRTVLLVSHNLRQVERLCTRVALLEHGKLLAIGDPKRVCDQYYDKNNAKIAAEQSRPSQRSESAPEFQFIGAGITTTDGARLEAVAPGTDIRVFAKFRVLKPLRRVTFAFGIDTTDLLFVATTGSEAQLKIDFLEAGEYCVSCTIHRLPLTPGVYGLRFGAESGRSSGRLYYGDGLAFFHVASQGARPLTPTDRFGLVIVDAEWTQPAPVVTHSHGSTAQPTVASADAPGSTA